MLSFLGPFKQANPETLGSAITIIFPDTATSTVPLWQPVHIQRLPLPAVLLLDIFTCPHIMRTHLNDELSLDTENINKINISTLDIRIWQHFSSNYTPPYLKKLANVPEVPVTQLYRDMINTSEPVHCFTIKDDEEDPSLIWTILTHPGTYLGMNSMIFAVCIGVHCFKRLWTRPATPRCQPHSPVSS